MDAQTVKGSAPGPERRVKKSPWFHGLVLAAVFAAFCVSFKLLSEVIGFGSPWLWLLLMFYFLGLGKVAEPLFILKMPATLRALRSWERTGDVYRRLGVAAFGRGLLRRAPLRYLNTAVYFDRECPDLFRVRRLLESSEANHFWAALLLMPYLALEAYRGRWSVVAGLTVAQLIVNVYPILHLRLVRGRLDRVIRRRPNGDKVTP